MSGHGSGRTREAERIAGEAFRDLVAAVEAGGQGAKSLARHGADLVEATGDGIGRAGDRIGSAVDESRRRAGSALDALAGRKPPVQWEWILAGAVAGALAGWMAARLTRRAAEEALVFEDPEPVVADEGRGTTP